MVTNVDNFFSKKFFLEKIFFFKNFFFQYFLFFSTKRFQKTAYKNIEVDFGRTPPDGHHRTDGINSRAGTPIEGTAVWPAEWWFRVVGDSSVTCFAAVPSLEDKYIQDSERELSLRTLWSARGVFQGVCCSGHPHPNPTSHHRSLL